jgi:CubicO group peptidase (beta-lactamase class C family)
VSIFRRLPRIRRSSDRPLGRRALTALLASAVIVVIPLGTAGVGATAGTVAHASGSAIEGQRSGTTSTAIAAAAPRQAGLDSRAPELTTADAEAWLDGLLPSMLQREGITGAVVSVVSRGEVVTQQGYGSSEAGTSTTEPRPIDADTTLFRIGSVSKLVTATAVMQLVDQGRVDLDEPVQNYVDIEVPNRFDRPITLRHHGRRERSPHAARSTRLRTAGADLRTGHDARLLQLLERARRLRGRAGDGPGLRGLCH